MFKSARLKLTAWYLLIIMCVSGIFSLLIYQVLVSEVDRFDRAQRWRPENVQIVIEAKHHIRMSLLVIDGSILAVAGVLGYLLAGRTLRPIQAMVDEQNRFISDASHELKTPLTSLKSAFEVYLRNKSPQIIDANEIIKESIVEVDKLKDLSESLLQLAQYEDPNGHTKIDKVNLEKIILESVHKVTSLAKKKHIDIKTNLQDITVIGNEHDLTELFVILLDNAIKYSGDKSEVHVSIKTLDHQVKITIKDPGIGIRKADLPHIFDRFYRADSARTNGQSRGYGLGLSIAKKIVDGHQGSISVRSKVGVGSEFAVCLQRVDQVKNYN